MFYNVPAWERTNSIENRIYREELKESLAVWIFSVLKGSSKCTNHVNVHKLYAVEYINTVCSLDYSFQFRIFFKLLNKLYNELVEKNIIWFIVITENHRL